MFPSTQNRKSELKLKNCINPANIRLYEDILKTSVILVFRRRLQDVLIKTNIFALVINLEKTSSRHLQNVLVNTNIFASWPYAFKTFSRRFQDVLPRSLQDIFETSSRRLPNTSSRHRKEVFNTSYKSVFKRF